MQMEGGGGQWGWTSHILLSKNPAATAAKNISVYLFYLDFLQGGFCLDYGVSALSVFPTKMCIISSDVVQLHQEPLLLLQHL